MQRIVPKQKSPKRQAIVPYVGSTDLGKSFPQIRDAIKNPERRHEKAEFGVIWILHPNPHRKSMDIYPPFTKLSNVVTCQPPTSVADGIRACFANYIQLISIITPQPTPKEYVYISTVHKIS